MSTVYDDVMSLVVDIGAHTTRSGYAGDEGPKQLYNSCVGRYTHSPQPTPVSALKYPINFYDFCEDCVITPCYTFHPKTHQHSLNEEVFEKIISYHCEGRPSGNFRPTQNSLNGAPNPTSDGDTVPASTPPIGAFNAPSNSTRGTHTPQDKLQYNPQDESTHTPYTPKPTRIPTAGLGVDLSELPILLSEPCNPSKKLRHSMCEILFEKFDSPACYLAKRALLSTFSAGRVGGLIVDIGAATLSIAPVTEAHVNSKHLLEYPIAGNLLDIQFSHILAENKQPLYPLYAIKKKFVGKQLHTEKVDCTHIDFSYLQYSQFETVRNLKEAMCKIAEDEFAYKTYTNGKYNTHLQPYSNLHYNELPDGTQLELDPYMYTVPEILFQPHLIKSENSHIIGKFRGLTSAVIQSISESEWELRKDLVSSIILTGGTANLPGLLERLTRSLQEASQLTSKARVTHIDRRYSSWVGGSILGSLSSFQRLWLSAQEYYEHGPMVADRKFD